MEFLKFLEGKKRTSTLDVPPPPAFPSMPPISQLQEQKDMSAEIPSFVPIRHDEHGSRISSALPETGLSIPNPYPAIPQAQQPYSQLHASGAYSASSSPSFADSMSNANPDMGEVENELSNLDIPNLEEIEKELADLELSSPAKTIEANFLKDESIPVPERLPTFSELQENAERKRPNPIFVETGNFQKLHFNISILKNAGRDFEETYVRVMQQGDEEAKQYERLRFTLEDIERRLIKIDHSLFEQ